MTLQLDAWSDDESDALVTFLTRDEWPFHGSPRLTPEKVREWIAGGQFHGEDNATFWLREDDLTVGLLVIRDMTDPTPIFDIRIHASARGRGLGRKALPLLAEHVFVVADKHRIEGHTRVDNLAMRKIFEACAWVKEAHHRQAWPDSSGNWHDAITYALLRDDWRSGTNTPVPWNDEP